MASNGIPIQEIVERGRGLDLTQFGYNYLRQQVLESALGGGKLMNS
jgi:hypothetical protein